MALFGTFLFGEETFGAHATIMISPDLGWSSLDHLFDGARNPRLVTMELEDLEVVDDVGEAKAPNSLIFSYAGLNLRVKRADIHLFGGPGKYYYKIFQDSDLVPITPFIYRMGTFEMGGQAKTAEDSKVI